MRWRRSNFCAAQVLRGNPAAIMDPELFNLLKVLVYLIVATAGIVLLVGWALKRFGPPK